MDSSFPTIVEPTPTPIWQAGFLGPLELEYLDGRNFKVTAPFTYETTILPPAAFGAQILVVPAGFVTDFGSIPPIFWPVAPPQGKYGKAYVIHDLLYRTPGLATRLQADDVLREAMRLLEPPGRSWIKRFDDWLMRRAIYRELRRWGGSSYKGGL
jgi:hypothetical protein